ncbi:MAG: dienelactone hydrolase family protein [Micropepsaceae bacterium]
MTIQKLDGPRVPPKDGAKADRLVVFVHGYGANGDDLIGLAPYFQKAMPTAAFASPNAPERVPGQPFGYQWFGITRLDPQLMAAGADSAAPILNGFIDEELERLGLDGTKLALVGFSQGTMMSLHVGLRRAVQPAAILGYSGALVAPERLADEMTVRPPIALIHGDSDPMVPVTRLQEAVNTIGATGLPVRWHVSRGVGHSIDPEGLHLGVGFLKDAFDGALAEPG